MAEPSVGLARVPLLPGRLARACVRKQDELQGLQERQQSFALLRRRLREAIARALGFSCVQVDRLLDRRRRAIVEEMLREAEAHQWLRAELGRRRQAEADVRARLAHVV